MREIHKAMLQRDQVHYGMDPMHPHLPRFTRERPILLLRAGPAQCPLLPLVDIGRPALVIKEE